MNLRDFQMWLNAHGAKNAKGEPIAVDGLKGTETRTAILNTFINLEAKAVTSQDINEIAARLGGFPRQVAAVAKVESAGGGWDKQGRLKALYERHYFWRRMQILIPILSNPNPGGYTNDANNNNINDSWEKVADAAMRNPIAAFESASWGKFQIMGAHASADPKRKDEVVFQGTAIDFVWWMSRSERNQYDALARFVEVNGLRKAFQKLSTNPEDCRDFAKGYNGSGYAKHNYHVKLAEAMK